ncbi:MAG: cytochrome c oxidase subunit 3 [Actinomycetota bacterium]
MSAVRAAPDELAVHETSGPVMGMVLFVASEAIFFAALFGGYFSIRASASVWPPASIGVPEIAVPTILTVILISSSVILQTGVMAVRRGRIALFRSLLALTVFLGLCFLALQAYDYSRLTFGIADGIYPSLFYVMTGLHMAHVAGGVILLSVMLAQAMRGGITGARHETIEGSAIYWHFVDVVWIGLYLAFYVSVR